MQVSVDKLKPVFQKIVLEITIETEEDRKGLVSLLELGPRYFDSTSRASQIAKRLISALVNNQ